MPSMRLCICTGRKIEDTQTHSGEKHKNAKNVTLHQFKHTIWGESWKKHTSATICNFPSIQAGDLREHLKTPSGKKLLKCNQCYYAYMYRQAIWGHIWKLTLEKSIQMQSMRLCICSGRQFEETVEKNVQMQPFVTLHLFMQAIWENIWKLPQVKSRSNAINATFHLFRQAIWENIRKLPQVKKCKNATNASLLHFGQTIWGDSWKKRTSATICDFPSIKAGNFRKHLKLP